MTPCCLTQKHFMSSWNLFCWEVVQIFMEIQVEIRKLLCQNLLFQGNSFINANQSEGNVYHFNQSEWSIVRQNKAKFTKFPWKRVLGTAERLNIFSNIQLIKTKLAAILMGIWKSSPETMKPVSSLFLEL